VNRSTGLRVVRVSPEFFDLLSAYVRYNRESEGAFDITVGPLMKVCGAAASGGDRESTGERRVRLDVAGSVQY
jgi:thiamine biosynthesis lipoprotein